MKVNDYVPLSVAKAIGNMTMRLIEEKTLTGEMASWAIAALTAIAQKPNTQIEKRTLISQLSEWSRTILGSVNLNKVPKGDSRGIELINAVARIESEFLSTSDFLSTLANDLPSLSKRNRRVLIAAIASMSQSTLLDYILDSDWCPDDVETLIRNLQRKVNKGRSIIQDSPDRWNESLTGGVESERSLPLTSLNISPLTRIHKSG